MTPHKAAAIAMWACFDYTAPHPPEEAATRFITQLEQLGYTITAKEPK